MAHRPYVSFAEVKEKVALPEVLEAFGIADRFRRKGDTLTGVCPLPSHQHGPSPNPDQFKIDRKNGVWLWHCFGDCQRGGDVVELVKALTSYSDAHVRFWFAERFGDRLTLRKPREGSTEKSTTRETPAKENSRAEQVPTSKIPDEEPALKPLRFFLNLDPDVPYLRDRGVKPETVQRYGLGLCNRGLLNGYIAIAIYGWPYLDGANPVAYIGRWPGDDYDEEAGRPRYKVPDGFPKSRVIYGLREAMETDGTPLIVVEGPFKVYHLVQAGYAATVAILGASMSDEQASILASTGRPVWLMFDGDEAGQAGMRAAAAKLIMHSFVRVARLPDGKQPDDLTPRELHRLLL